MMGPTTRNAASFIIGILFTTFISWMKFPKFLDEGGLVPRTVAYAPKFVSSAGALDFGLSGLSSSDLSLLVGSFFLFLYLDFVGSCITFMAMGKMQARTGGRTGEGTDGSGARDGHCARMRQPLLRSNSTFSTFK
jgi:xanthine/uracil/vitamin C permease (AzgA family)